MFWELFKKTTTPVTTAAVSPGDFYSQFIEMGKYTDNIICILVSKVLTASHAAAESARATVMERNPKLNIKIIDSKTSTGAMGFIVLDAARAAQENKSVDEIMQIINNMIPRVKWVAMVDSLKYLIRLGRAPKGAEAAEAMGVKSFYGMLSGTGLVDNLGGVPGKEQGMLKIIDMIKENTDTTRPLHVMVHYSDQISDGETLKEMITSRFTVKELYMTPYSPVMACHSGPVLSAGFYSED
jgi:DegV family protein with EDD domain